MDESWGNRLRSRSDCVPFPTPGAPTRMTRAAFLSRIVCSQSHVLERVKKARGLELPQNARIAQRAGRAPERAGNAKSHDSTGGTRDNGDLIIERSSKDSWLDVQEKLKL
jgi:hypothetical protein